VRFRAPPFTPEVVRAALNPLPPPSDAMPASANAPSAPRQLPANAPWPRRRPLWARVAALAAGVIGLGAAALGWRASIAPIAAGSANVYTAEVIERGRVLAAAGDCIVCHTAPGGVPNAGGRAMATPFGMVYSTNLTPDLATGIGAWSFSAFQRAMREGVSRDGKHLYPAFPYTAFTKTTDADLTALYAYLMAQPGVSSAVPETTLAFPFSLRPLMAGWNALFLTPGPVAAVATQSAEWNRGAYLVDGVGHCGACHTARSALGAEQGGTAYLGGAMVDDWEAPALTALSRAPVPWTETELFNYLRHGHSVRHGSASGPMAPVVQQLGQLPESDLRAMATYLASFNTPAAPVARSTPTAPLDDPAHRLFTTACGACHHDGSGPQLLGQNIPLALNTNLHSDRPDNLLRLILEGIREPATKELGFMPAYRDALDDAQLAQLAAYLRQRFAPGRPPWPDLQRAAARVRATPSSH
jgi:nicotinate dehydrogenase subunit B